jgi:hypothetical protein
MQQLAGLLTEVRISPEGGYADILKKYIESVLTQEEYFTAENGEEEGANYLAALRQNPPKAYSLEDVAKTILDIDEGMSEAVGVYPGEFYSEAVIYPLVDIGKQFPHFKKDIKKLILTLNKMTDSPQDERDWEDDYN